MSRATVLAAQAPFERIWNMLNTFCDVCPDDIWAEKNGGWPVWQQVAHTFWVLDWFVCSDAEALISAPFDADTAAFKTQGELVPQNAMKRYAAEVKPRVDAWLAGLTDEELPKVNAILTKKIGREMSYMATVILLASHSNYHLGACDAALRDHGLKGVF